MKKALALCLLFAVLASCKDDTAQLLKTIDGRWQINSVTYSGQSIRDSVVTLNTTVLSFYSCQKSENNNDPTNCQVDYLRNGQPFRFAYQAPNGGRSLYISPTDQMSNSAYRLVADQLAGSYEVLRLTDSELVMRQPLQGRIQGYQYVQYSASK